MKKICAAFAVWFVLLPAAAAFAQQGFIHGNGDPRVITPTPNCGQSRFYIDDTTEQMYTSGQGSPCAWTLPGAAIPGVTSDGNNGIAVQGAVATAQLNVTSLVFDANSYASLNAAYAAACAYATTNESGSGHAAFVQLHDTTYTLTGTIALCSGVTIEGVPPRIVGSSNAGSGYANGAPNGGSWINCNGATAFTANSQGTTAYMGMWFRDFGVEYCTGDAFLIGGNGIAGMQDSGFEDIKFYGNPTLNSSDKAIEMYNSGNFKMDTIFGAYLNTLWHYGSWNLNIPGNVTVRNMYLYAYPKSVANGNNTEACYSFTAVGGALNLVNGERPDCSIITGDNTANGIELIGSGSGSGRIPVHSFVLTGVDIEGPFLNDIYESNGEQNYIQVAEILSAGTYEFNCAAGSFAQGNTFHSNNASGGLYLGDADCENNGWEGILGHTVTAGYSNPQLYGAYLQLNSGGVPVPTGNFKTLAIAGVPLSPGYTISFIDASAPYVACTATGQGGVPTYSAGVVTFTFAGSFNGGSLLCTDNYGNVFTQSVPSTGGTTQTFTMTNLGASGIWTKVNQGSGSITTDQGTLALTSQIAPGYTINFIDASAPYVACQATGQGGIPTYSAGVVTFQFSGSYNGGSLLCTDNYGNIWNQTVPSTGGTTQTFTMTNLGVSLGWVKIGATNGSVTTNQGTLALTSQSPVKVSNSITPAAATASSCVEQTFTYTGLTNVQGVHVSAPALGAHIWIGNTRISATNTLAIAFCADATAGTPASGTYIADAF